MTRGIKIEKKLYNIIIIISLFFLCFFSYKIINYKIEEKKQNKLNDSIINVAIKKAGEDILNLEDNTEKYVLPIEVDFSSLNNINNDIIGWIYCEDTPINYPIVQAADNDYYLRRLIDKSYNQAGTIFMDCKNSNDFSDFNTIIYGHNMKNSSMFGSLINYSSQDYYNNHKQMFLYTPNKTYKIELFAGFTISSESNIYKFPKTEKSNEELIKMGEKKSTFSSDVNVANNDKIITLSTCSYNFENARYVLIGVIRNIE